MLLCKLISAGCVRYLVRRVRRAPFYSSVSVNLLKKSYAYVVKTSSCYVCTTFQLQCVPVTCSGLLKLRHSWHCHFSSARIYTGISHRCSLSFKWRVSCKTDRACRAQNVGRRAFLRAWLSAMCTVVLGRSAFVAWTQQYTSMAIRVLRGSGYGKTCGRKIGSWWCRLHSRYDLGRSLKVLILPVEALWSTPYIIHRISCDGCMWRKRA